PLTLCFLICLYSTHPTCLYPLSLHDALPIYSSTSSWHVTATNFCPRRRTVFAIACDPMRATVRSTTDVNSSTTAISSFGVSARTRAIVTRNCSPFDRTPKGRTHDGGDEKPTEERSCAISLIPLSAGNASKIERFGSHSNRRAICSGQSFRAMVLFPLPDGPTISPTFHGRSSIG